MKSPAIGVDRRSVLRAGLAAAFALLTTRYAGAASADRLAPPDRNGLRLLPGFSSRVVARSGEPALPGGSYRWHAAPDGGACFAAPDGGWIYVSNAELKEGAGGVSALRFDAGARVVDAYPILAGTTSNCAGGPTPWGTWLSCEEHPAGLVWECDPFGATLASARPALGRFKHEAAVVDPATGMLYLTEDMPDGGLYRFTPASRQPQGRSNLDAGRLEIASVTGGAVRWLEVPDPQGALQPTRHQLREMTPFRGGEGAWFQDGCVYFTTKIDNRVWELELAGSRLRVVYQATRRDDVLVGVDNVTGTPAGELLVAEDGGDMQLVIVQADGRVAPLLQVAGHPHSEIAGPAFDPAGRRLYFSSQRGAGRDGSTGITYEVSGPFEDAWRLAAA